MNWYLVRFIADIVRLTRQHVLRLIAIVWLALGMSLPVQAWAVHDASHAASQVSVEDHHHHDIDGALSIHQDSQDSETDDGFDHLPSILLSVCTLPANQIVLREPASTRSHFRLQSHSGPQGLIGQGLHRPPRFS